MRPALPAPEYYGGSAPPAPSAGNAPIRPPSAWQAGRKRNARGRFPRSLSSGQRVRHPALPLRPRHGYAAAIHRDLRAQAIETLPRVPRPPPQRTGTHREPAQIHRVRAGVLSRDVTQPVPLVYLPASLTTPGPSGSPRPPRLCRGCSHPPRRSPAQAASSFTLLLRQQGDEGLSPPNGQTAPRGALTSSTPSLMTRAGGPARATPEPAAVTTTTPNKPPAGSCTSTSPGITRGPHPPTAPTPPDPPNTPSEEPGPELTLRCGT